MNKLYVFKEYVAWCCITFLAVVAILSVVPLGVNGETAFDICGAVMFYILGIITPLANLAVLDPRVHK